MEKVLKMFEVAPIYKDHEEIPILVRQYIETVADVYDYAQIPLEEINSFLAGLYEFKGLTIEQADEWEDGWVL